jgi:hypothetical protein
LLRLLFAVSRQRRIRWGVKPGIINGRQQPRRDSPVKQGLPEFRFAADLDPASVIAAICCKIDSEFLRKVDDVAPRAMIAFGWVAWTDAVFSVSRRSTRTNRNLASLARATPFRAALKCSLC